MKVRQPARSTPWIFLAGISAVIMILAKTNLLQPTMQYIQTDQVSNWQIIACIALSIAGLWITFFLLNIICNFYANKTEQLTGNSAGAFTNNSRNHGGEKL